MATNELILFDASCVLCSGWVRFVARADRAGRFRFVTAQSETGRALYREHGLDPDAMETNVVVADGRAHVRLQAFAAVVARLGWPWRALAVAGLIPGVVGDPLYDLIARNRYRLFGRRACPAPSAELRGRLVG